MNLKKEKRKKEICHFSNDMDSFSFSFYSFYFCHTLFTIVPLKKCFNKNFLKIKIFYLPYLLVTLFIAAGHMYHSIN